MVEVEISPDNGRGRCYCKLPFIPPRGSSLTVIENGLQRHFTITDVSITTNYDSDSEMWLVDVYLGAMEMIRE